MMNFAPEDIISCDKGQDHSLGNGCKGGSIDSAYHFLMTTGVVSEDCFTYFARGGWPTLCLEGQCIDGSTYKKYFCEPESLIEPKSTSEIQQELFTSGPLSAVLQAREDLLHYGEGVYHPVVGEFMGYQSVKLLGWGVTEEQTQYWLAQMSWDSRWGEEGEAIIKVKMGEVKIET